MACKRGIRKNLEVSKKYYEEQRKYDPIRELWKSLVTRVHQTDEGYSGLTPDERLYFAVGMLDGEVYNGGMHQFFSNSSGEFYGEAVNGLLELKALAAVQLLTKAKKLIFRDADPPGDQMTRNKIMRDYPDNSSTPEWVTELEKIDEAYYDDPDRIGKRLDAFARERGLVAPFEKPEAEHSVGPST